MSRILYDRLGVASTASDAEIRAAFRRLAKQYHPDRNPGDKAAEDRFKQISAAYGILGEADLRKRTLGREKVLTGEAGRRGVVDGLGHAA